MPVTTDILATYKGPRPVVARLLRAGPREDRLVALAMGACFLIFIAQVPRLSRVAHLEGLDFNAQMGGSLLALVFILPLVLYGLAFILHLIMRALGGTGAGFQSRLALFWSVMAASPIMLLNGLVAGFIGSGPALNIVGTLWCVVVLWVLMVGLHECYWGRAK